MGERVSNSRPPRPSLDFVRIRRKSFNKTLCLCHVAAADKQTRQNEFFFCVSVISSGPFVMIMSQVKTHF